MSLKEEWIYMRPVSYSRQKDLVSKEVPQQAARLVFKGASTTVELWLQATCYLENRSA